MTDRKTESESAIEAQPTKTGKKRLRGSARHRLAKASARAVRENSDKLARAIFDRALEGNVDCAKFLLALSEKPRRKNTVQRQKNRHV